MGQFAECLVMSGEQSGCSGTPIERTTRFLRLVVSLARFARLARAAALALDLRRRFATINGRGLPSLQRGEETRSVSQSDSRTFHSRAK